MYLEFRDRGWWVSPTKLHRLVMWLHQRLWGVRKFLSVFQDLHLHQTPNDLISYAHREAEALGITPTFIRLPRDSTRIQVFDLDSNRVCQVAKPGYDRVTVELEVRTKTPDLASPAIFSMNSNKTAYVEELIDKQREPGLNDAISVLEGLAATFYKPRVISFDGWVDIVAEQGCIDAPAEALILKLEKYFTNHPVFISPVHGDLNPENIIVKGENESVLIDWEYTRKAMVTYDAWLVQLYWQNGSGGERLESILEQALKMNIEDSVFQKLSPTYPFSMLPLTHLVERYTFISGFKPALADSFRERLRNEIIDHENCTLLDA